MKAVLMIAVNFVREQRWPILVLLSWVVLLTFLGLVTDIAREREDLLFIFKQVAVYVVAFSIFFGGSALYSERRSRRILSVLSKGVARSQYLSGLVIGVTLACSIYCFSLGLTGSWTLGPAGFPVSQIWFLMACLVASCMLAGTVALMFSTFLNPFLAAGATAAMVLGVPVLATYFVSAKLAYLVPSYSLALMIMHVSFGAPGSPNWFPVILALVETAAFWALSSWIFNHVDIAVAVD